MVVTIGDYELVVKEELGGAGCHKCFYCNEPDAVCKMVHNDIKHQVDESLFNPRFGGCGLKHHILIRNTPQDLLTYLEEKLNDD